MIIGQDVCWSHTTTRRQHLVGALDRLGADALARLAGGLVARARSCLLLPHRPNMGMAIRWVATAPRSYRRVDVRLLWRRSWPLLLSVDSA
jgi:hypothetical protein